jgi:serine/threonine-protein kinase
MTPAMTPERYQRIGQLFDEALDLLPEERAAFLERACGPNAGEDAELRAEVERLLAHHRESEEFLSHPATSVAASLLSQNPAISAAGKQIRHYQLVSLQGMGGMGEVWLARDSQLERNVALMLLPEQFTRSQTHVRRFAQEAKAASALSHSNIITIHEIGEADRRISGWLL